MKKIIIFSVLLSLILCLNLIFSALPALATAPVTPSNVTDDECAESISAGVKCFGASAFGQEEAPDLFVVIANIINILLMLLGLIFLVLLLYGGFTWMTAMGNEEKVKKAKQTITSAAIGLLIILVSYGIVSFVFYLLSETDLFSS